MINLSVMDYRIRSDERQLILSKVKRDEDGYIKLNKKGEEYTSFIGYYITIEQVLQGIKRHYTFTSDVEIKTLDDYINEKLKLESE